MAFKFYIDNQLTDQPDNDRELVTMLKRDNRIGGMVITQESSLIWSNTNDLQSGYISGYQYLKSLFDASLCDEAELTVYDEVSPTETFLVFKGVLKITQLQIDEQRVNAISKIQDNSFYSYIYNNWELKVDFRAIQTKNKIDTDPLSVYHVDLFNGCTGVWAGGATGAYYHGYNITEVLEFLIRVITDEKVTFQSNLLSSLTYPLLIFKGESLLNPYTIYPLSNPVYEVSLKETITELSKIFNLSFYLDYSNPDLPIFCLEDTESTYAIYGGYDFNEPLNLKTYVDESNLYGNVKVGSTNTVDGDNSTGCIYTMNEAISIYGFKQEEFFPLGQCNTNTVLDLVNSWVISNNAIQDILVGNGTTFIDNYFLIECDGVDTVGKTANGHQWDFFGQTTPPVFYNLGINNFNKMQYHSSKFETNFGNFLGVGSLGFRALLGDNGGQDITYMTGSIFNPNFIPPSGLTINPAPFPNESTQGGYDGSGNYNNILFNYTVPVDGTYSFGGNIHIEIDGTTIDYFNFVVAITQYDSGLVQKSSSGGGGSFQDGEHTVTGTLVCEAVAGDVVILSYSMGYVPNQAGNQNIARTLTVIWDSFFECNGTPEGGVVISNGNNNIRKLIHEFQYDISPTDWRTILANSTGSFKLIKDGVTRLAWIQEAQYSNWTGRANIKMISSNATT